MDSMFFPCRSSRISKFGLYSAVIFYPSVAFLLLFALLFIGTDLYSKDDYNTLQVVILLLTMIVAIVLASFLIVLSWKCYLMETRHITLNSYGFVVRGKSERRCAWSEIGSIGIIAYAASASKLNYQTQICIFFEPFSDDELRRLRNSYLYGVFNQDKYVLIDYEGIAKGRFLEEKNIRIDDLRPHQMKL